MKKNWIVIGIIIFVVIGFAISFKYVYFSSTEIKLIDTNGNPIQDGKIRIGYSCYTGPDIGGGEHWKDFGYRESSTNSQGIVRFNSLNSGFNFLFFWKCRKYIAALKEGYCPPEGINLQTCLREIKNLPIYIGPEIESFSYGASYYIQSSNVISWNKKEDIVTLKKTEFPKSNVSCSIFKDICLNYDEFNSLLNDKDPAICAQKFISNEEKQNLILACEQGAFITAREPEQISLSECLEKYRSSKEHQFIWKDLNYECYTEVAFAKKDSSICSNVIDSEMQRRCFEFLALELKDISLCKNVNNERVYEYCKFDVIKKIGDASKCSLINIKDIHDFCKVYFS